MAHVVVTLAGGCFWCLVKQLHAVGFSFVRQFVHFQKYYLNFMWPKINIYRLADTFIVLRDTGNLEIEAALERMR